MKKLITFTAPLASIALVMCALLALAPQVSAAPTSAIEAQAIAPEPPGELGPRADRAITRLLMHATAEASGISIADVRAALKSGQSFAQIAEANGSSREAVVQDALKHIDRLLGRAVVRGRMTAARADDLRDQLVARVEALVDDPALGAQLEQSEERLQSRATRLALARATAEVTDLPLRDVVRRSFQGESLEQIAQSAGKSASDVIAAATELAQARLDRAVNAGIITPEEAEAFLAAFAAEAEGLVTQTR